MGLNPLMHGTAVAHHVAMTEKDMAMMPGISPSQKINFRV